MSGYAAIQALFYKLGLPADEPSVDHYGALARGLQRFAANEKLLLTRGRKQHRVLKKHLLFTIFVPGGRADRARTAVDALSNSFLDSKDSDLGVLQEVTRPYVRFWRTKALNAFKALRNWDLILRKLQDCTDSYPWVVKNVPGLGQKAAAHFLRNIGISQGVVARPIIDVHIHKALEGLHFRHDTYQEAEAAFRDLSWLLDVDVLMLDACLWCGYSGNWDQSGADFDNFGV